MLAAVVVLTVTATLVGCIAAVPDVRGMSVPVATRTIQSAGLVLGPVTETHDPVIPLGTVVLQTPSAGGSASRYSAIALEVSAGPESLAMPALVGGTEAEAVSALKDVGLVIALDRKADPAAPGTVIGQVPASGTVASGSTVRITISAGPDLVRVPDIHGVIDAGTVLTKAGLKAAGIAVHGPIDSDAAGIGEAYRQAPAAGSLVPRGATVTYRFWWERR
jgi:serine/threonine-protein kinase